MMKNVRMLLPACGYAWLRARSACEVPGCIEYVLENVVCVRKLLSKHLQHDMACSDGRCGHADTLSLTNFFHAL